MSCRLACDSRNLTNCAGDGMYFVPGWPNIVGDVFAAALTPTLDVQVNEAKRLDCTVSPSNSSSVLSVSVVICVCLRTCRRCLDVLAAAFVWLKDFHKHVVLLCCVRLRHVHTCERWLKWKICGDGTQVSAWASRFQRRSRQPRQQGQSDADASEYSMPYSPFFFSKLLLFY